MSKEKVSTYTDRDLINMLDKTSYVEIDGKKVTVEQIRNMQNSSERLKTISKIMDSYGLDALIGLFAGVGDLATALISVYAITEAIKYDMPKAKILKMIINIGVDLGIGIVPLLGDLIDYFYKSNKKNSKIFEKHLINLESHFTPDKIKDIESKVLVDSDRGKVSDIMSY